MFETREKGVTGLTARQEQVLRFIREFTHANGYPPTVREIGSRLELSSPSTVHVHLGNLERLGSSVAIHQARALELVDTPRPLRPLRWSARSPPVCPSRRAERRRLHRGAGPAAPRRRRLLLRVDGDSMIDAGIHNDDLIVVHRQATADNGDIVVALVGDEATTKRFFREAGRIRLQPANDLYEPIVLDEVELVGRSWECCVGYEPRRRRHILPHARRICRRAGGARPQPGGRLVRLVRLGRPVVAAPHDGAVNGGDCLVVTCRDCGAELVTEQSSQTRGRCA